ncbi:MAG: hypothetical protein ACI95C_002493 [Pseudohongiellaceae bacterium]|jgi:uncharacterized protein (DUF885 family)
MRSVFALSLSLLFTLTGCGESHKISSSSAVADNTLAPPVTAPLNSGQDQTSRFVTWIDTEFAELSDFSPMAKTRIGDKSNYGDLDDVSEAALGRKLQWRRASVAQMQSEFDRDLLDTEAQLSWDLWEYLLEVEEMNLPFLRHSYIFGRNGPQTKLPNDLINYQTVSDVSDMEAYISRLQQSQRYMEQYLERAILAAADGIRAPFFDYDRAISEIQRVLSGAPFEATGSSAIWKDITDKLAELVETGAANPQQATELEEAARVVLVEYFKPGYEQVLGWLQADRVNVPNQASGASALPNGDAYYAARLSTMTTLPLSADEIHATGRSEVARIQEEMESIKRQVGFEGSLQEFFNFMRENDDFYFDNTDQGRADYLAMADQVLVDVATKLPDYFGLLPKASLEVRRVEAFRESAGGAAHYRKGTPDGSRPGVFYVHLADMRAVAINRLENLAYHEGLPGHHMQRSIQQELTDIPKFRADGGYTAYTEGWGLYAEFLAKEMGGYPDPYSEMGRLSSEIWRSVRLVVDTAIHTKGWSEDQAVQYALENSPRPELSVRSEVKRYFNNPGQATAYKIGMIKILEYRAKAEAELGVKFDIKAFHDTVLGSGPLPMVALEAKIDRWIDSVR